MPGSGLPQGHGLVVILVCACAGLMGQFLVFSALLALGFLTPYTSYSFNYQVASLTAALVAGAGMVLGALLVMATFRGVAAASMLAGVLLLPFGISVVYAACTQGALGIPLGANPSPLCDPGQSVLGLALDAVGAGIIAVGIIRLRRARTGPSRT